MVQHHLSFDTFHKKADRIVRMVTDIHLETVTPFRGAPNPMSKALRTEFSFVEKTAMYAGRGEALISVPNASGIPDKYKEEDIFAFVEPELFEILDLPIIQGDVAALREPNTAMLTEKIARKYYGHTDVIDKTFRYDNEVDFRVVGILRDLPDNTDYQNEILVSWTTRNAMPAYASNMDNWGGITGGTYCFALLQQGHAIAELESAMPAFLKKYHHSRKRNAVSIQTTDADQSAPRQGLRRRTDRQKLPLGLDLYRHFPADNGLCQFYKHGYRPGAQTRPGSGCA
ncbi:MAG: ABC transporter permease [Lewinellaceae bacterium]|nr:ABC transporter permease [Lewinellaceae bacterium]